MIQSLGSTFLTVNKFLLPYEGSYFTLTPHEVNKILTDSWPVRDKVFELVWSKYGKRAFIVRAKSYSRQKLINLPHMNKPRLMLNLFIRNFFEKYSFQSPETNERKINTKRFPIKYSEDTDKIQVYSSLEKKLITFLISTLIVYCSEKKQMFMRNILRSGHILWKNSRIALLNLNISDYVFMSSIKKVLFHVKKLKNTDDPLVFCRQDYCISVSTNSYS